MSFAQHSNTLNLANIRSLSFLLKKDLNRAGNGICKYLVRFVLNDQISFKPDNSNKCSYSDNAIACRIRASVNSKIMRNAPRVRYTHLKARGK